MVVKLTLAYRGTAYAGWQRQTNALAVQEVVEKALGELVDERVRIHGAGRTDAGVHAEGQVAHFQLPRDFPLGGILFGTNHRLPDDVRLLAAERMADGFHARTQALGKSYVYRIDRRPVMPPQAAALTTHAPGALDLDAIRAALGMLVGLHDFSAFAAAGGSHTQPYRRLFGATLDIDSGLLRLRFVGDGFLRGMVRAMVGTLLEIGRGKRSVADIPRLLAGRPRSEAGPSAPARGLTLERVFYPPRWQPLSGSGERPASLW